MQRRTIQKILEDEDTLNLLEAAKAILEKNKYEEKHIHIPSRKRSLDAWQKIKAKRQEEEAFRQRLAKVWNKLHGGT